MAKRLFIAVIVSCLASSVNQFTINENFFEDDAKTKRRKLHPNKVNKEIYMPKHCKFSFNNLYVPWIPTNQRAELPGNGTSHEYVDSGNINIIKKSSETKRQIKVNYLLYSY